MTFKRKAVKFYRVYMVIMGAVGHFLFLFQAWKIFETGSSADVSLFGFLIAFISILSWLIYGLIIKDTVLIIDNIFGVSAALICLYAIVSRM